jgi:hypothetical protein
MCRANAIKIDEGNKKGIVRHACSILDDINWVIFVDKASISYLY